MTTTVKKALQEIERQAKLAIESDVQRFLSEFVVLDLAEQAEQEGFQGTEKEIEAIKKIADLAYKASTSENVTLSESEVHALAADALEI